MTIVTNRPGIQSLRCDRNRTNSGPQLRESVLLCLVGFVQSSIVAPEEVIPTGKPTLRQQSIHRA